MQIGSIVADGRGRHGVVFALGQGGNHVVWEDRRTEVVKSSNVTVLGAFARGPELAARTYYARVQ